MNPSRRRFLQLGVVSFCGTAALATNGSRTAMAAEAWEANSVEVTNATGELSSLEMSTAEGDISLDLRWQGISNTSEPISFTLSVRKADSEEGEHGKFEELLTDKITLDGHTGSADESDVTWTEDGSDSIDLYANSSLEPSYFAAPEVATSNESAIEFELVFEHEETSARAIATVPVIVTNVTPDIPDGGAHHWPVADGSDATVLDVISGAHLDLGGAKWVAGEEWVGGYAIEADGESDTPVVSDLSNQVDVGDSGTLIVTVEALEEAIDAAYLFAHHNSNVNSRIQISAKDGRWRFGLGRDWEWQHTDQEVVVGEKLRLALRWDNGVGTVFINGQKVTSAEYTPAISSSEIEFNFAHLDSAPDTERDELHFNCRFDNPIVHGRALSAAELTADYDVQPWA